MTVLKGKETEHTCLFLAWAIVVFKLKRDLREVRLSSFQLMCSCSQQYVSELNKSPFYERLHSGITYGRYRGKVSPESQVPIMFMFLPFQLTMKTHWICICFSNERIKPYSERHCEFSFCFLRSVCVGGGFGGCWCV